MVRDGEIVEGIVKRVVDLVTPPILAVDIDGDIEKVSANAVMLKEETTSEEKNESEVKTSPTVIRCTKERYAEALNKVTDAEVIFSNDNKPAPVVYIEGLIAVTLGHRIGKKLFDREKEIELDKYMLLWEFVNELVPSKLAKNAEVGDAYDFEALSGALTEIFWNLITELFGAEND